METFIVGVFLAIVGLGSAAFPNGVLYPFEIDSLLTCHVDNPLAGLSGQPDVIPETIMRLPFDQFVKQGGHPNFIGLPAPSGFQIPRGTPSSNSLLEFLGNDYDQVLSSPFIPLTSAPRGCEIRGSTEGSGGDQKVHISVDRDPAPILDLFSPINMVSPLETFIDDITYNQIAQRRDPTVTEEDRDDFNLQNLGSAAQNFFRLPPAPGVTPAPGTAPGVNNFPDLCEIHIALCPLNTTWAELPEGYFPKFLAQGTCSRKNCSFPRGKFCEENFTYTAYVTVLRWDCCFDKFLSQVQWACGWRKVQIPLLCDCTCNCGQVNAPAADAGK